MGQSRASFVPAGALFGAFILVARAATPGRSTAKKGTPRICAASREVNPTAGIRGASAAAIPTRSSALLRELVMEFYIGIARGGVVPAGPDRGVCALTVALRR